MGRGGAQPRQRRAGRWDVNAKIAKSDESVPPFAPQVRTPRGPPDNYASEIIFIGCVIYRKITSDFPWGCTTARLSMKHMMSQLSDASKSQDFQLVAFCEQTGGRFSTFDGVPLRPPGSYPPGANRAKPFDRKLEVTVNLRFFMTHRFEGECCT